MRFRRYCRSLLAVMIVTLLLSGCGFQPRNAADIPAQLHPLYLSTHNPYSAFTTELKEMLQSLHIKLTPTQNEAPYTLAITHYRFTQSHPTITTTNLAVTFTYTLSLQVSVLSRSGKTILPPRALSSSRSLVRNASQVYTPGAATLAKQQLRRDLISEIYYVLISEDTKDGLTLFEKKHHHAR